MAVEAEQLTLPGISLCYRCHNCGRDVGSVKRTRRFRLCAECWREIVPDYTADAAHGSPEQAAIRRYWEWYRKMEQRFPLPRNWRPAIKKYQPPDLGAFWPFCRECGAETQEYDFSLSRSLFGGHRATLCPLCDARKQVEAAFRLAGKAHPDWDDESWLDLLWQSNQEAFELGVLPDYWFVLRGRQE